ncbi:hypothetical protein ACHAXA_011421 [Cyclostephanos tholiformis]|uniref:Uncharacterized protein n=1 Tax=Cyclostephanos tholiformis TaxID=382380 RepID=A0ABD3RFD5_9STRA
MPRSPSPSLHTTVTTIVMTTTGGEKSYTTTNATYCNAILIGNTKNVWSHFIDWLMSVVVDDDDRTTREMEVVDDPSSATTVDDDDIRLLSSLERIDGPFDTFVEETITRTIRKCLHRRPDDDDDDDEGARPSSAADRDGVVSCELFWSDGRRTRMIFTVIDDVDCHRRADVNPASSDAFLVSMTRAAKTTGVYWYDDAGTKMCVHSKYGTWTAFRALVVFETTGIFQHAIALSHPPPPRPCMVTDEEVERAKSIFAYALGASTSSSSPSSSSDNDDGIVGYGNTVGKSWEEVRDYLRCSATRTGASWEDVPESMRPWIWLRDCYASVGNYVDGGWRYDAPQLLYHYTRDRKILMMELRRAKGEEEKK